MLSEPEDFIGTRYICDNGESLINILSIKKVGLVTKYTVFNYKCTHLNQDLGQEFEFALFGEIFVSQLIKSNSWVLNLPYLHLYSLAKGEFNIEL